MPSSVIDHFSYDAETLILEVTFLSGKVYAYKDVPEKIYQTMRRTTSKGRYLNFVIKPNYAYEELN
ncbi:KTSC domain-containing protein [Pedobacter duraquae]|uniref:KTSC domain-containing protein n=1 Tax=Pedobacter duraquae TaxID=425511 RepID=A0A4R6IIY7_9SPHI|nr:KTSC domain-containing protein [Pedobacter duraquae]TDO21941.1 KTSC domain-containing protein [Pedobacter duraquae]